MKSPFQKELDSLDLTYAQEEIIKQAVERYVIGEDEVVESKADWYKKAKEHGGTYEEYWRLKDIINSYNNLRNEQRIALRGEPDLSYNGGNHG